MGVPVSAPENGFKVLTMVHDRGQTLEETLTRLAPRVKLWLCRDLGAADVDDALQDALTDIVRALPSFRGDSQLDTYAYPPVSG